METRLKRSLPSCGICHEKVVQSGKLSSCTHLFCYDCITSWAQIQNTCPLCKMRFSKLSKKMMRKAYRQVRLQKTANIEVKERSQGEMRDEMTISLEELTLQLFRLMDMEPSLLLSFLEEAEVNINLRMLPEGAADV